MPKTTARVNLIRNFVFGVEDSLVSTIGLVSGVAVAGATRQTILLTGLVLVFVEAFSMAVGSLLSENSAQEVEEKREVPLTKSLADSLAMLASYFFSGLLILLPYVLLTPRQGFYVAILLALSLLFVLGLVSGRLARINVYKQALTMTVIGGAAIIIGITVGTIAERI